MQRLALRECEIIEKEANYLERNKKINLKLGGKVRDTQRRKSMCNFRKGGKGSGEVPCRVKGGWGRKKMTDFGDSLNYLQKVPLTSRL